MLLDDTRDPRRSGPLGKALALLGGAVLLVLGFMFSLLLVAFAVATAAVVWGYLWWKTRALRRQLRERGPAMPADNVPSGHVFDGEAVRVEAANETERRPDDR